MRAAAESGEATLHRADNSSRVGVGWGEWGGPNNKNKLRVVSMDAAAIFAACDSTLFGIREAACVCAREMSAWVPAR